MTGSAPGGGATPPSSSMAERNHAIWVSSRFTTYWYVLLKSRLPTWRDTAMCRSQKRRTLSVEFLEERQQLGRLHDCCFSLQVMQTRVQGIAFSRAVAIGSPQSRHVPYVPFSIRSKSLFDGLQDLGVSLLQLQGDVHLVVTRGLVGHVALPGVVLHRGLERFDAAASEELSLLPEQRVLVA